jgi:hypothetical protein
MRKALVLGFLGLFIAGSAMACGWGVESTASSGEQQTVMTDKTKPAGQGG